MSDRPVDAAVLRSTEREAWVIPNGSGHLWNDHVFNTEAETQLYIDRAWHECGWKHPKHKPARAIVRLSAVLADREAAADVQ